MILFLPRDILLVILSLLSHFSLLRISRTCSTIHKFIQSTPILEQKTKELAEQKIKELAQKQATEVAAQKAQETNAPSVNPRVLQNEITRFALLMRNKIHQHWRQPIGFDYDGLTCKVSVKLLPTGDVVEAVVIESSGSLEFDRSTELAIKKASPLPMPEDTSIAKEFRQFTFTFRPEAA